MRSKLHQILRGFYGLFYWAVIVLQILISIRTWRYTITYEYFCGNPLMEAWSFWFIISVVAGLILLPGGLWAMRHKQQCCGRIYGVGFLLYIVVMLLTLLVGVVWGTAPDFIFFHLGRCIKENGLCSRNTAQTQMHKTGLRPMVSGAIIPSPLPLS